MKFRERIDRNVIDEVKSKIEKLKIPRTMTVRPVLVHEGELSPGVTEEDYFDAYISSGDLLVD